MKWTRTRPGLYTAGPYAVMSLETHRPIWTASGPDFTSVEGTKADAQLACQRAAHARLIDISDDVAEYAGQRCRVSMITATADGTPLYCLVKPKGKRQCLLRNEFKVVMP